MSALKLRFLLDTWNCTTELKFSCDYFYIESQTHKNSCPNEFATKQTKDSFVLFEISWRIADDSYEKAARWTNFQ